VSAKVNQSNKADEDKITPGLSERERVCVCVCVCRPKHTTQTHTKFTSPPFISLHYNFFLENCSELNAGC
jgi:hypothetical protein